jgi:hypothetical protein
MQRCVAFFLAVIKKNIFLGGGRIYNNNCKNYSLCLMISFCCFSFFIFTLFKNTWVQNHHPKSISTPPQKTAQQFFSHARPILTHCVKTSPLHSSWLQNFLRTNFFTVQKPLSAPSEQRELACIAGALCYTV